MKLSKQILCGVAVVTMAVLIAPDLFAQSASGRALMIYKEGVTLEEENADRAACNQWAIEQTGFDPSAIYMAQQAGINTRTILRVTEKLDIAAGGTDPRWGSGAFGGASTSADRRRMNELYANYLRAGALCLEGRGYTVAQ